MYSLLTAFFSPFVVNDKKGDVIQVSLVLASFDVSNIAISIVYPCISSGANSKTIFHCGLIIIWLMNAVFGCIMEIEMKETLYIVFAIMVRLVMGGGVALVCCSGAHLISCATPDKFSVAFIAWAISATWLGDMVGPLLGGLLEAATQTFIFPFVFISSIILICQIVLAAILRQRVPEQQSDTMMISFTTWYAFLFRFEIIMVVAATFIIALGMGALETDLALYLNTTFDMGEATIALVFGLMPVMFALVAPITSFLNRHPFPISMLAGSVFFFCPGFGFLASGSSFNMPDTDARTAVVIICVCLIGIGVALGKLALS